MSKRSLATLAALVATSALAGCAGDDDSATDPATTDAASASASTSASESAPGAGDSCTYTEDGQAAKDAELPPSSAAVSGELTATITTSAGDIPVTLDATAAPCTVNSFVSLAEQGYFDATPCHRLTTEGIFVLQCGDPSGTGSGGPGYAFDDELSGSETYPAGTLAMANAGPGTNGSQFFMVYDDTELQPDYTVFGTIDAAGLTVVADVAADGSDEANGPGDGSPNTAVEIESVTVG